MLLSKLSQHLSQRRCQATPFSVCCGAMLVAVIGMVGCSSTDGRGGMSMTKLLGAFQRDADGLEERTERSQRSDRSPAPTPCESTPREQKSATPAASTTSGRSASPNNAVSPVANGSRLTTPPPAPTPATTGLLAARSAAAQATAPTPQTVIPQTTAAPLPPAPTSSPVNSNTDSAVLQPPPPPEPRIPAALRKKTVAESADAPKAELVPESLPQDSPEIAQLLTDLRKVESVNADSVDRDKCDKIISELRKIDADADPAFYKSMVAFARTVLIPSPPKTDADQHVSQNETPPITPVAAASPSPEAKPPLPATTPTATMPPRPLSPSTVAIVPQDTAAANTQPAEKTESPVLTPPVLAPPATTLTISDNNSAPSTESQTNSQATPTNSVPNAVFVPRGGNGGTANANESASIVPVAYNGSGVPSRDGDWQQLVQQASQILQTKATSTQDEVRLRILALALGNQTEAARTIDGIDPATRSFWASELLGLSVLLDERSLPDASSRNAAAIYHLARAQSELRKECPLKIQQMRFVEKWYGFGSYTPLTGDFNAGETASLYLELENNCVRESPLGFNTRSAAAYVLIDGAGTVVARVENIAAEETSQSRRRDSCLLIPVAIPKTISPGPYQLKITVTDLNHDKLQYAIEQIPLRIRTSARGGGEE
ncbi:MAG: hypothetical protein ACRC46_01995 [Thermoguttaceae bacterium]